jgi:hypothetical protein
LLSVSLCVFVPLHRVFSVYSRLRKYKFDAVADLVSSVFRVALVTFFVWSIGKQVASNR